MSELIKKTFGQIYFNKNEVSEETISKVELRLNSSLKKIAPLTKGNKQRFLEEIAYHYKMLETLEAQYLKEFGARH